MADFGSRVLGSEQIERTSKGINKSFGIVGGGAVTVNAGLVLNVAAIAGNDYMIAGVVQANAYAGGTVTLDAAHATLDRLDMVYIDTTGAVGKVTGTAAATPAPPEIGDTRLALAEVSVVALDTVLASSDIHDKKQLITPSVLFVAPHAVSGTGGTLASAGLDPLPGAVLVSTAAAGSALFAFRVPTGFQGLLRAYVGVVSAETNGLRWQANSTWGNDGEAYTGTTDSIVAATRAMTSNQVDEIDVITAFTGIAAGDWIGFEFERDGAHAGDTITTLYVLGLHLEYA